MADHLLAVETLYYGDQHMVSNNTFWCSVISCLFALVLLSSFCPVNQAQAQPDPPQTLAVAKDEEGIF
jgi:hypothetical protein